ncbi:DUF2987 domain-containing protein [Aeromonas intestinalis]
MKKSDAGLAATLLLIPALGLAQPSQPLELQYATFYSQMKTAARGDFGDARLGFYLTDPQNSQRCTLLSARVSTPEREVPAEVTVDGELRLPYDDDLNLDKASVWVELGEPHERCDLSVQVMADAPKGLRVKELQVRQQQMMALLDKLAGMIGKHFLPKMEGVRISLVSPSGTAYLSEGDRRLALPWQDGQLLLSNDQLADFASGKLQLDGEVLRLTPWLHQG